MSDSPAMRKYPKGTRNLLRTSTSASPAVTGSTQPVSSASLVHQQKVDVAAAQPAATPSSTTVRQATNLLTGGAVAFGQSGSHVHANASPSRRRRHRLPSEDDDDDGDVAETTGLPAGASLNSVLKPYKPPSTSFITIQSDDDDVIVLSDLPQPNPPVAIIATDGPAAGAAVVVLGATPQQLAVLHNYLTVRQQRSSYECDNCRRGFTRSDSLGVHRNSKTPCEKDEALCVYNNSVGDDGVLVRCTNGASGQGGGSYCSYHKTASKGLELFCCIRCRHIKLLTDRHKAAKKHWCKACGRWVSTLEARLTFTEFNTAENAKRRHLVMSIDRFLLMEKINEQEGRDHWTGVNISWDKGRKYQPYFITVERLDQNVGYTPANNVLSICEMNGPRQWTEYKLLWWIALHTRPLLYRLYTDDNVEAIRQQLRACWLRIRNRWQHEHSVVGGARFKLGTFDVTEDDLYALCERQQDSCAVSGISFHAFIECWWPISVDCINDAITYTKNNIRLVCLEFNTAAKWTDESTEHIYASLEAKLVEKFGPVENIVQLCEKQGLHNAKYFANQRRQDTDDSDDDEE